MSGFFINLFFRRAEQEPPSVELFFPRIFTSKISHLKCVCQLQIDELVLLNSFGYEYLSSLQKDHVSAAEFQQLLFFQDSETAYYPGLNCTRSKNRHVSEPSCSCECPVWIPIYISL